MDSWFPDRHSRRHVGQHPSARRVTSLPKQMPHSGRWNLFQTGHSRVFPIDHPRDDPRRAHVRRASHSDEKQPVTPGRSIARGPLKRAGRIRQRSTAGARLERYADAVTRTRIARGSESPGERGRRATRRAAIGEPGSERGPFRKQRRRRRQPRPSVPAVAALARGRSQMHPPRTPSSGSETQRTPGPV